MIRLLKPLSYYQEKYGTWMYGLHKLYLLMEKQHNRGQEGAGLACTKLAAQPGEEYMFRERALGSGAITEIFHNVNEQLKGFSADELADADFAQRYLPFASEIYMGHLRYSTTGKSGLAHVHPFMRRNNWRAKNLCLCGNFNLTNVDEVFESITSKGQHPRIYNDTYIMLELMGHRLDRESERVYDIARQHGLEGMYITDFIEEHIDISNILRTSTPLFDGGYVLCGFTGSGEMFTMRDPWNIRPAYWYHDDEVLVAASERPVIQTTFDVEADNIHELHAGEALIVRKNGQVNLTQILQPKGNHACSFERIYFSRGSDSDIYRERKALGEQLTTQVEAAIDGDLEHTVFSYIPNTAEVAFYGMTDGFRRKHQEVRTEKVVWKDIKLRTFIAEGSERKDLAAHVYDISYGSLQPHADNLVIIDDSIVRGTTLKESILRILDRLHPRKIVLVSSCPQVRYPDYYGIDMSRMDEFIAFRAAVELHIERGNRQGIDDIYRKCIAQRNMPAGKMHNYVAEVYAPFTPDDISAKIIEMLRPEGMTTPIQLVFQSLEGLHKACPNHPGDWYFSGNYPTPGGIRLVNQAFINWYDNQHTK